MADQAGPSTPKRLKKPCKNVKHGLRLAKAKRLSEKQQIEALERAVVEFVSFSIFCTAKYNSISWAVRSHETVFKLFLIFLFPNSRRKV
jgi:hypothetical protein